MKFFKEYVSNTLAGTSNQLFFDGSKTATGRVFYKIYKGGMYEYSFLFSNIIDSTYGDGSVSNKNIVLDSWELFSLKVATLKGDALPENLTDSRVANEINSANLDFKTVTFDGKTSKEVAPGEFFASDGIALDLDENGYICLEIVARGDTLPYHEEAIIPIYRKTEDSWVFDKRLPIPSMVGVKRPVSLKIGFIGDSITQGIGVPLNHYTQWNTYVANGLLQEYAYWNLGIGFGRASDMSSLGAWMFKALQNDLLVVCYGVNDIMQGASANTVKADLEKIVNHLLKHGKRVVLQTVPPFDYNPEQRERWENVNSFIKTELKERVDLVFDVVPHLGKSESEPNIAKFGGHPNEEGSKIWGEALLQEIKKIL